MNLPPFASPNQMPSQPPPTDKSTVKTTLELGHWLEELEAELGVLQKGLFHAVEKNPSGPKRAFSLQGELAAHCTSAAQLVGFVRTINERLGFSRDADEEPAPAHWSGH